MAVDPRAPCVIGVAQRTVRGGDAPEPLDLWEDVCRRAAADAGARGDVLAAADSLQVVYCQSWRYDDPPGRLAERLGITPRHRLYSGIGGTTPQLLVQNAAEAMLRGELDLAVICGAEALDTVRRAKKEGRLLPWSFKDPEKKPFPFEAPFHPAEVAHNVFAAWLTFAVWDVARRARLGVAPDEYRRRLGELMAPMTKVAAANPYAWFPVERSVDDLITPRPENRMVGYPYTKYMVSVMDVDMAAALVVATHERADDLGVPQDRRVYLRGWCYGLDPTYVAEHPDMASSPAMRAVFATALGNAGVGIDDVAHLDLYSCFASSVNFALDALGIGEGDGRPVTVTGGLPFFGGAGSDYMTHAIATMVEVLRADPGSYGLVTGVGMHMTKHIAGVYCSEPGPLGGPVPHLAPERSVPITDVYAGPARVAAYTVAHARDGAAEWGLAVCDLPDGTRAYARVDDPALLDALEREEWVGRRVDLVSGGGNVNVLRA